MSKTEKSQNELCKYLSNKDFQHFANASIPPSERVAVPFFVGRRHRSRGEMQRTSGLGPPKDAKRRENTVRAKSYSAFIDHLTWRARAVRGGEAFFDRGRADPSSSCTAVRPP